MEESSSMFQYIHAEDQDLPNFTTFEDEVTGLQYYMPECNLHCFDLPAAFKSFNSPAGFGIECSSSAVEDDQIKFDGDALELYLAQEEEIKQDNGLQSADEQVPLGDFSPQSTHQGTLLADTVSRLNNIAWENSFQENVASESCSSCFQESKNHVETSNLSSPEATVFHSAFDKNSCLLDKMTAQDLHQVFRKMFGRDTSVKDKQWLKNRILFGLQNRGEIINGLNTSECDNPFRANEGKSIFALGRASSRSASDLTDISDNCFMSEQQVKIEKLSCCNSLNSASSVKKLEFGSKDEADNTEQKQSYKPTNTCTKGEQKPNDHNQKCGASSVNAREEFPPARSYMQQHLKGLRAARLVFQNDSLEGPRNLVPFDLPVQERKSTRTAVMVDDSSDCKDAEVSVSTEDFDMGTSSADAEDDLSPGDCATWIKKVRKRRQRQMKWTPSEVMKLVDGVSKYGVGKWTHIKKSLFSSSSHRSSSNLKDKWRNLQKASCNEMQKKRKVEQRHMQASHQLPESVWRQIRELAVAYSCPGENKSNV